MRFGSLVLGVVFAMAAHAGLENPQILPFGEREVLTGNAGVAGSPSVGAVVYNPAGLALLDHSSLAVAGSTYLLQSIKASPLFNLDGANLDYSASGFDSIPATITSVFRWTDWAMAFSVLVPETLKLNNRLSFTTANTNTSIHQLQTNNDLWLSFALAKREGTDWAWGFSLYGMRQTQASTVTLVARFPATPTLASVTANDSKYSVLNVAAAVGVRWQPSSLLDFGLRARLPSIRVSGSGDGFSYKQVVNGTAQTIATTDSRDMRAYAPLPFDLAFGVCWHVAPSLRVLTDVSLQTGTTNDVFPGTAFSSVTSTDARARYNLGLEIDAAADLLVAAGFMLNPSTVPATRQGAGDIRQDFMGLTGGISWVSDRVRTGLGLFYFWSTGTFVPFNTPAGTTGQFSQRGLGATLVFSYSLGEKVAAVATPPAAIP